MAGEGRSRDPFFRLNLFRDSLHDPRHFDRHRTENGLRVLLVQAPVDIDKHALKRDRTEERLICLLAVGAGNADEPTRYPGLAHLVEHLYQGFNSPREINERIAGADALDLAAVTFEDLTVYRYIVARDRKRNLRDQLTYAFHNFNYSIDDYSDEGIIRDVQIVCQEYELTRGHGAKRFEALSGYFHPEGRAMRNLVQGNRRSLLQFREGNNGEADMKDLRKEIKRFVQNKYKIKNALLLLYGVGDYKIPQLRRLAEHISKELKIMEDDEQPEVEDVDIDRRGTKRPAGSNKAQEPVDKKSRCEEKESSKTQRPCSPPEPNPSNDFNKVYWVQPALHDEKLYLSWYVKYEGFEEIHSKVKPLLYVSALLKCCYEGSLIDYLRQRRLLISLDVRISRQCFDYDDHVEAWGPCFAPVTWSARDKAHLFTISFCLTQEGIQKPYDVVSATMCYLKRLKADDKIYKQIQRLRNGRILALGAYRVPEQGAKKLVCSALYPQPYNKNILTDDITLHEYNEEEIQRVLCILQSTANLNVVIVGHLGQGHMREFPEPEEFRSGRQGLGFKFAQRCFSEVESANWSNIEACGKLEGWKSLRMPTLNELETPEDYKAWEDLCFITSANYVDLTNPNDGDLDYVHNPTPTSPNDGGRQLHIRPESFHLPGYSIVEVQIWQPNYNVRTCNGQPARPQVYFRLLVAMMEIHARLLIPTWAHAECSTFQVTEFNGLTIQISGLHHLTKKWLHSVYDWLTTPATAFGELKDVIFESARKTILQGICTPSSLSDDIMRRGLLVGHDAFVECHEDLSTLAEAADLYERITDFIQQMRITIYAKTSVRNGFDGLTDTEKFYALPAYNYRQPPDVRQAPLDTYFRWVHMSRTHTVTMKNPNTGSHLSSVRHTYQLQLKADEEDAQNQGTLDVPAILRYCYSWVKKRMVGLQKEAMTYSPKSDIDDKDPHAVNLSIEVASDCTRFSVEQISDRIDRLIEDAYQDIAAAVPQTWEEYLFRRFRRNDSNHRKYVVQVKGHDTLDMSLVNDNPHNHVTYLLWADVSEENDDWENDLAENYDIEQNNFIGECTLGREVVFGNDLRDQIPNY